MYDLDTIKHRLAEEKRARKQADSQLVEHANELAKARKGLIEMASIVAGIPYPVILFDKKGTVTFSNPASIRYWGSGLIPGASIDNVLTFLKDLDIEDLIEGNRVLQLQARKKGEYFRFVFKGDSKQKICHLYCLDVTEYESEKIELRKARKESEELLTSLPSVLIGFDQTFQVMLWNKTAEVLLGVSEVDALGRPINEIDINWDRERIEKLIVACQENASFYEDTLPFIRKDGAERLLEVVCTPVAQQFSRRAGVFLLVKDVTDQATSDMPHRGEEGLEEIIEMVTLLAQEMSAPIHDISENLHSLGKAITGMQEVLEMNKVLLGEKENGLPIEENMHKLEEVIRDTNIGALISTLPSTVEKTLNMIGQLAEMIEHADHTSTEAKENLPI